MEGTEWDNWTASRGTSGVSGYRVSASATTFRLNATDLKWHYSIRLASVVSELICFIDKCPARLDRASQRCLCVWSPVPACCGLIPEIGFWFDLPRMALLLWHLGHCKLCGRHHIRLGSKVLDS